MPFACILRRTPAISVLAALALALSPGASPAAIVNVDVFGAGNGDFGIFDTTTMTGVHFDPTITVGDTIHWVFRQGVHDVKSANGQAESWVSPSPVLPPGTFDHTFTQVGTFNYYCTIHGFDNGNGTATGMIGFVRVVPVPEPTFILTVSAIGMALGGCCARWRRRSEPRQ